MSDRRARLARIVSTLMALAILLALRLPTNCVPILNVDEADFVVEAGALLDGGRPYIDFVEKKPPLIYVAYASAMALLGRYNLPGVRVLLIGYILATALVLSGIARRLYGDRAALIAMPAYALAVSAGPPMDLHAANAETWFLLPLVIGTRLCLPAGGDATSGLPRLFVAGALIGMGALIKQQAGMQLAILLAFLWLDGRRDRSRAGRALRARTLGAVAGGFCAVWVVALAALISVGSLGEFYYWTIEVNRYYIANGNNFRDGAVLMRIAVGTLASFVPVLWILGLGRLVQELVPSRPKHLLLPLWFAGSLVPIVLGGRFFPHYFLQLFPALALLAAAATADLWTRLAGHPLTRATLSVAVGLALAVPVARKMAPYHDPEVLSIPHAMPDARAVARYVREHTPPDARILVWGYGSALYYLAERRPATRFAYVTYLVGAVEGTPAWWSPFHESRSLEIPRAWDLFFEDLDRHPPTLIVDTAQPGYFSFSKFPPSKYPRLMRYLERGYQRTEVAGFPVWRRIPGA